MNCELGECVAVATGRVDKFHTVAELANLKGKNVCGYHSGIVQKAGLKVFTFEYLERKRLEQQAAARTSLAEIVGSPIAAKLGGLREELSGLEGRSSPTAGKVGVPV